MKTAAHVLKPDPTPLQESVSCEGTALYDKKRVEIEFSVRLTVLEGRQQGKLAIITPTGLAGVTHNSYGSTVQFGTSQQADFQLTPEEGIGELHFQIRYNSVTRLYYLEDLGASAGTFVKLEFEQMIGESQVVMFGDNLMEVKTTADKEVVVHFLDGQKAEKEFVFPSSSEPVLIGRMTDCQLKFDDSGLSRYQCVLRCEDGKWRLRDGDGNKASTNGTWLFVKESFPLRPRVVFKAGETLFEAEMIEA